MARLGIITGLQSESRILDRLNQGDGTIDIRCAGADAGRARSLAVELIAEGADGLLSFGIAGGLVDDLAPGSLVVPSKLATGTGTTLFCAPAWRRRLSAALESRQSVSDGDIASGSEMIADSQSKVSLHHTTGAVAVDMESAAIGGVASQAGKPFLVIRAIADPASRAPPAAALAAVAPNGGVRIGAAAVSVIKNPAILPSYMMLWRDSRSALETLRRVALTCGPFFGFV